MKGYQLTFYTEQNRQYQNMSLTTWIIREAKQLGIYGVTLFSATEGIGHDGRLHSARFFELADQPVVVTMALTECAADQLLNCLNQHDFQLFYVKTPIEFGTVGSAKSP